MGLQGMNNDQNNDYVSIDVGENMDEQEIMGKNRPQDTPLLTAGTNNSINSNRGHRMLRKPYHMNNGMQSEISQQNTIDNLINLQTEHEANYTDMRDFFQNETDLKDIFDGIGDVNGQRGLPNSREGIEMWLDNMNKEQA